jgi:trehalose/maltose hydrolase-like predicted phosphorylase
VASGDTGWLRKEGLEVFRGCAEYWAGKAVFDEADGRYHILGVCGSDEHAGVVDDNATTNWGAAWTLRTAAQLVREAGETPPAEWETIADTLVIPWDDKRGIPLQMRQWEHGRIIKQADATMLIHPWHYPMDEATMERTVDYYRAHYEDNPIMMGYAVDGIIDCRLDHRSARRPCIPLGLPARWH